MPNNRYEIRDTRYKLVIGAAETADLAERELRAELDGDCIVVRVHDLDDPAWEATDLSGVALAVVDDAHPHEVITAIVQRTERHLPQK